MAERETNTVTITLTTYNTIKLENFKYNAFMDNLYDNAKMSKDHQYLVFDNAKLSTLLQMLTPERYAKKLSYIRGLYTKHMTEPNTVDKYISDNEEPDCCLGCSSREECRDSNLYDNCNEVKNSEMDQT